MSCEHIIGLLHFTEDSDLVNLKRLIYHIQERKEHNQNSKKYGMDFLVVPEWTLLDYADGRKSTNLRKFKYCPECGEKIDWKRIKREALKDGITTD